MADDVPSPIDFRDLDQARDWESKAEQRPGRGEILDRLTEEAARLTTPGSRILELGSGPGFLPKRLLDRLPDITYTALDFSPAMHELARQRLGEAAERVTFVERSFKTDDWNDGLGPFDLVVTNQAVHELRHKRHALALHRQVFAVLRPGGSYLVADHFSDPGGMTDAGLYMTQDEQRATLQAAGFDRVDRVDRLAVAGTLVLHAAVRMHV